MRVTLVSHSYLAEENRKKLSALGEKVQLEVLSPRSIQDTLFSFKYDQGVLSNDLWTLRFYRQFTLPYLASQYLLSSLKFNFTRFRPHIVHVEYDPWTPIFLQILFAKQLFRRRARIVCTVKKNTYSEHNTIISMFKDYVARYSIRSVSRFIAVNKGAASIYQSRFGVEENKFDYITQLGVDVDLFKPPTPTIKRQLRRKFSLTNREFLVGYCGRMIEDKGIRELIEAVRRARRVAKTNLGLALLGSGDLSEDLSREARATKWLRLLPVMPHHCVAAFLKCLDVFVLPSRIKAYHLEHDAHALLEALSTGLPCIGTFSGVIPEILKDVGLVIEAENAEALKVALVTLVEDYRLRDCYARNGRKKMLNLYSNESVASMTHDVYRRALQ